MIEDTRKVEHFREVRDLFGFSMDLNFEEADNTAEIDLNKLVSQNISFLCWQAPKELMIKNNQLYLCRLFQDVPTYNLHGSKSGKG